MPHIYGDRIRLRAVEKEDIDKFMQWVNDPEVTGNLQFVFPMSRVQEEQWVERAASGDDPTDRVFIIEKLDGSYLGNLGLHDIDRRVGKAVVGIVIGEKDEWGKGYGTEALRTILQFSFDTLNLQKVDLTVLADNERAQRAYEKCGFEVVGRLPRHEYRDGKYVDVLVMSVLRENFEALCRK